MQSPCRYGLRTSRSRQDGPPAGGSLGPRGRPPQDLPRDGRRRRQDLPHAPGGSRRSRRGARRGLGLLETARPRGDRGAGRGPRGRPAAPDRVPRHDARGDGPPGHPGARARARASIDELAHTNAPGRRAREALRGRRRHARRRHRRLLDGQRAAPREPQRPGGRAHRRPRARDRSRRRAGRRPTRSSSSTSRPRRWSQRLREGKVYPPERASPPRSTASSRSRTSRRCARWRCARWPRTSRPSGSCATRSTCARSGCSARAGPADRRAAAGAGHARRARRARRPARVALVPAAGRRSRHPRRARPRARSRPPPSASSSRALRRLAAVLGAQLLVEEGDDVAAVAARVARERGTTYVLMGAPQRRAAGSAGCASRSRCGSCARCPTWTCGSSPERSASRLTAPGRSVDSRRRKAAARRPDDRWQTLRPIDPRFRGDGAPAARRRRRPARSRCPRRATTAPASRR